MVLPVGADGLGQALDFNEFERRLSILTNALDDTLKGGKVNSDRQLYLSRIASMEKVKNPTVEQTAALAGDLLRLGQTDRAINLLIPRTRDRRPNYFVSLTLSQIHASRGEWSEAIRYLQDGLFDTEMPEEIAGLTAPQRDWLKKLDSQYLLRFYQLRQQESESRRGLKPEQISRINELEDVLPLFPIADAKLAGAPVRYQNDAGAYPAGRLAASEQAKLPPDAIAIVQQLLLWFPGETRLYWLLAELYAASNNLTSAANLFDKIAWSRQYGNRKIMMEHRAAVRSAVPKEGATEEALLTPPTNEPTDAPPPDQTRISMRTIWYYFGGIALVGLFALLRGLSRRNKGNCGPTA
jgi:predicted Zn-dependent protease